MGEEESVSAAKANMGIREVLIRSADRGDHDMIQGMIIDKNENGKRYHIIVLFYCTRSSRSS